MKTAIRMLARQIASEEQEQLVLVCREAGRAYGSLSRMKRAYRHAFHEGDHTSIPRFDETVAEIQLSYPWIRDSQHLFEILKQGASRIMVTDQHTKQAAELLLAAPTPSLSQQRRAWLTMRKCHEFWRERAENAGIEWESLRERYEEVRLQSARKITMNEVYRIAFEWICSELGVILESDF